MRVESLGFLRFAASIIIVLFHYRYDSSAADIEFIFWPVFNGHQMVTFFFVLSGYVNYLAYGGKPGTTNAYSTKRFVISRMARILPLYFLALILAILAFTAAGQMPGWIEILLHFSLMQAWFPAYAQSINFVTWTLSVDLFLYMIFPIALAWMHRPDRRLRQLLLVNSVIYGLTWLILMLLLSDESYPGEPSDMHNFVHNFPLFHCSAFLLGMLAGYWITHTRSEPKWLGSNAFVLAALLTVFSLIIFKKDIDGFLGLTFTTPMVYAPFFAVVMLALTLNKGFVARILENPIFVYLGSLSYGIYIFQILVWLIYKSLVKNMLPNLSAAEHLIVGVVVLCLFSALTYHAVEKPGNSFLRRKLSQWM